MGEVGGETWIFEPVKSILRKTAVLIAQLDGGAGSECIRP